MPPVTANFYTRATGSAAGAPASIPLPLAIAPTSISYSAVWQGGDESAEVTAVMPVRDAQPWMDQLQCGLIISDHHGRRRWRGFIEAVEVDDGVVRAATTLDGMANEVRVQYTNRSGVSKYTSAATDSGSTGLYGRHQALVTVGEMDATEADLRRDTYLARSAWPRFESGASLRRGVRPGLANVTIRCRGWWAAMYWSIYLEPTAGFLVSVQTQTVLAGLIDTALNDSTYGNVAYGTFDNQSFTGPYTNARLRTGSATYSLPVTDATIYRVAGTTFEEVAARGDESGIPISYMTQPETFASVALGYQLPVVRMRTWAGNSPTSFTYTLAGDTILGPSLAPIAWSQVRPNAMVRRTTAAGDIPPQSAVDTSTRFFLARTEYRWSGAEESLSLEPLGGGSAAMLLARVR